MSGGSPKDSTEIESETLAGVVIEQILEENTRIGG